MSTDVPWKARKTLRVYRPSHSTRYNHKRPKPNLSSGHESGRTSIAALKEVDGGAETRDVCRRLGVTEQSFYRWRRKYGGLEVNDAKRLRELQLENGRLKRVVADLVLDNQMLRDVNSKKW